MRRKWSTAAPFAISLIGALAIGALVVLVFPRAADQEVRAAYQQLSTAVLPVRVIGWIRPLAPSVSLSDGGYVLSVQDPDLGELVIGGAHGVEPAMRDSASLRWSEGDQRYAVLTTATTAVAPRIVPLDVAKRQLQGGPWDTPLLYLWYLPLLLGALSVALFRVFVQSR
jgi:hypothetical protein